MATRVVALNYSVPGLDPNAAIPLHVNGLFCDTANTARSQVLTVVVALDPAAPGSWTAAIKDSLVTAGINNGYSDLTSTGVFVPTYG